MYLDVSTSQYVTNVQTLLYHWEQRYMAGDIMSLNHFEEETISEITFALFEDSNWYKVNYYTGGLFRFGKLETCIFSKFKCVYEYFLYSQFCPENKENKMRCTSGRLQKGRCKFYTYNEGIPFYFQYYSDKTKGGEPYMNYCPIAHKEIDFNNYNFNFYPGSCSNGIISFPGTEEVISQTFCVISSVIPNGGNYNLNVERSVCYPM